MKPTNFLNSLTNKLDILTMISSPFLAVPYLNCTAKKLNFSHRTW